MKKPKFIQEHEELDYKRRLVEFMQSINPNDKPEALDKLRQKYMAKRGE